MTWTWDNDLRTHVTIVVKNYFQTTIEDLELIIQELRIKSRSMDITVDLAGAKPWCHEVRQITHLILDVFEYTKNDRLLDRIYFKNAGFLVRSFYRPISLILPGYVRDIIEFI
jgi:hypothetical protein